MTHPVRLSSEDDDPDTVRLLAAVAEARAAVERGDVIPHDRVRDWLLDVAQGKAATAPRR